MGARPIPPPGNKFINRGDPAAVDADQTTISVTGSWTNLDLSSVLPAGTTAVLSKVSITDANPGRYIQLRTDGNSNSINTNKLIVQVNNVQNSAIMLVPTNGLQIIEYYVLTGIANISLTVLGWFK